MGLPRTDENSNEWRAYRTELEKIWAQRPKDELYRVVRDGGLWRRTRTWVKIHPVEKAGADRSRRITVFLEDLAGNRVKTVPNRMWLEIAPPASITPSGDQPMRDGEITATLQVPEGVDEARLTVTPVPVGSGELIELSVPFGKGNTSVILPVRGERTVERLPGATEQAAGLKASAKFWVARNQPYNAGNAAFLAGQALLHAGLLDETLAAWREGRVEYKNPLCMWGELQLLRLRDQQEVVAAVSKELREQQARSVPAQFIAPVAGEQWYVPDAAYWRRLQRQ